MFHSYGIYNRSSIIFSVGTITGLVSGALSAVLAYAEMLNELDLEGVEPTSHAVAQQNVMRNDEIRPSLTIEDVLGNTSNHQQNQFLIQTVLDES